MNKIHIRVAQALAIAGLFSLAGTTWPSAPASDLSADFRDPPREFSLMPFWFWNNTEET